MRTKHNSHGSKISLDYRIRPSPKKEKKKKKGGWVSKAKVLPGLRHSDYPTKQGSTIDSVNPEWHSSENYPGAKSTVAHASNPSIRRFKSEGHTSCIGTSLSYTVRVCLKQINKEQNQSLVLVVK